MRRCVRYQQCNRTQESPHQKSGCLQPSVDINRLIRGREYAVYRDGGGMIGTDVTDVQLCALKLRRLDRFLYEYDFGDSWIHDLPLEARLPINPRKIYPVCIAGRCPAPPEDCGGPHAFMANRRFYAGFGRGRSDEEIKDLMDEFDDEESDSFSDYDPERFDRRQINRALGGRRRYNTGITRLPTPAFRAHSGLVSYRNAH